MESHKNFHFEGITISLLFSVVKFCPTVPSLAIFYLLACLQAESADNPWWV
jgi:hypothetical protein